MSFFKVDKNSDVGQPIIAGLQDIYEGIGKLLKAQARITQLKSGDGSQASHFGSVVSEGGFTAGSYATQNECAQAGSNELDSVIFKLTTNGSVTDVWNAITQAKAKFGA